MVDFPPRFTPGEKSLSPFSGRLSGPQKQINFSMWESFRTRTVRPIPNTAMRAPASAVVWIKYPVLLECELY